jgi:tRNA (guanine37-N1)-methyltransferase
MRFDIITAFPESFSYLDSSLFYQAKKKKILEIKLWQLRDFTTDRHKTIDDRPFGGGPGMVLKIEPIYRALQAIKKTKKISKTKVILTSLAGELFTQKFAKKLSQEKQLIIVCGHYEGVDERVKKLVDLEVSIGPYVLSGGELPAMVIVDAVSRYIPGFLKNPASLEDQREQYLVRSLSPCLSDRQAHKSALSPHKSALSPHKSAFISVPVYTRPRVFKIGKKSYKVPSVLLSGDHKKIIEWQRKHARVVKF